MTSKSMKPSAPKPLSNEEKAAQVARFLAQKREALFTMILTNAIRSDYGNGPAKLKGFVDEALEATDYALEKLYPLPKDEAK